MGLDGSSLHHSAAILGCLLGHQLNKVLGMDDLTVELLRMPLQHLEGTWVGLFCYDNRAVGLHDACLGFSDGLNAATCRSKKQLLQIYKLEKTALA